MCVVDNLHLEKKDKGRASKLKSKIWGKTAPAVEADERRTEATRKQSLCSMCVLSFLSWPNCYGFDFYHAHQLSLKKALASSCTYSKCFYILVFLLAFPYKLKSSITQTSYPSLPFPTTAP